MFKCVICEQPKDIEELYSYGSQEMIKAEPIGKSMYPASLACYKCQSKYIKDHTAKCKDCKQSYFKKTKMSLRCWKCQLAFQDGMADVASHKQRTLSKGLEYKLDTYAWMKTLKHFNHSCVYCGKPYEVLDHYVPVKRGGATVPSNEVPACARCNSRKAAKMPRDFTTPEIADAIEAYLFG